MSSAVAIMDREGWQACTDNLVIVDPSRRVLLWVPRDLWSHVVGDRINRAYAHGGAKLLQRALAELALHVDGVLCLQRSASERGLASVRVRVPVPCHLEFLYPLYPTRAIECGHQIVAFGPGDEWLEGERIHMWIGARYTREGPQSDLPRCARQQTFVRRLLEEAIDFRPFLANPSEVQMSSPRVLDDLATVRPDWTFATFGPLDDAICNGAMVLLPRSRWAAVRWLRRLRFAIGRRWLAWQR